MSDYQFKLYVQEREVERKYEELGKRMSAIDTIFNTANLFKVYSRTMGIMVLTIIQLICLMVLEN